MELNWYHDEIIPGPNLELQHKHTSIQRHPFTDMVISTTVLPSDSNTKRYRKGSQPTLVPARFEQWQG